MIKDVSVPIAKLEQVPVVCEYPDVFPNELPGIPPDREVEFGIDLLLGTQPISIPPYRMVLVELKELNEHRTTSNWTVITCVTCGKAHIGPCRKGSTGCY